MVRSCLRMGVAAVVFALPGSAQDATGAIALSGGGGGLLDIDGLQNSLKSGGVEGLNKILQAMTAANGLGSPSPHLTKDASGNAMYDFRDIGGLPKSRSPTQVTAALPAAPKAAPLAQQAPVQSTMMNEDDVPIPDFGIIEPAATKKLVRKAMAPAALPTQQAPVQAPLTASSRPDDELPMPDFGIIEPPKTRKPRAAVRSLVGAKVATEVPVARPTEDEDDEAMTPEAGVQESRLVVWPPETPVVAAPQLKVANAAVGRVPPAGPIAQVQHSTNTDEAAVAALADGLESMRHNLDTLVSQADTMLHTHQQVGSPVPTAGPASASIGAAGGAAGAEILKRLQKVEDENAQLKKNEAAQALRLEAVEAKEQKESAELKSLEDEHVQLRDQVMASQSAAFLQDKMPHNRKAKWGIRTFFHKKEKSHRQ